VTGSTPPVKDRVTVRPVAATDAGRLLAWANDPITRTVSFQNDLISVETHERWLAARLASTTTRFYIGRLDEVPIGQVRFERQPGGLVEISISIAPEARGRGLGRHLLAAGLAAAQAAPAIGGRLYVARVRAENAPSIALFEATGFVRRLDLVDASADTLVYARAVETVQA
jgi:RimJ/RimL family protein N-acetyltransferase